MVRKLLIKLTMGSRKNIAPFLACVLGLCTISLFYGLFVLQTPYPFSARGDNFLYFLPLIKAHTDVVLNGELPRMIWGLGSGWDPFESGQMGLFYPPFHIANALSRLIGKPLALLEISVLLHWALLLCMVIFWAPGKWISRFFLALCLICIPAPLFLGMHWHIYGVSHIWWIGIVLWITKESRGDVFSTKRSKAVLLLLFCFFYQSSHPQMFVWGGLFLIAFLWVLPKTQRFHMAKILGFCLLPFIPSLLYLKWVSGLASPGFFEARDGASYLLEYSQTLWVALSGSLFGNIFQQNSFRLWDKEIAWQGVGIFFQPLFLPVFYLLIQKRQRFLLGFSIFVFMLLGVQSLPFLGHLALGPFSGFRITLKLVVFSAPFFILLFYFLSPPRWSPHLLPAALAFIALVSIFICYRGQNLDFRPVLFSKAQTDFDVIYDDANQCLQQISPNKKIRLAMVGHFDSKIRHANITLSLLGNRPLLFEQSSAHLYEPLERFDAARGHLQLSLPWGVSIGNEEYKRNQNDIHKAFQAIGVTHLFSPIPELFPEKQKHTCLDHNGRATYFLPLAKKPIMGFPAAQSMEKNDILKIHSGGLLHAMGFQNGPPLLNTSRPIQWEKTHNGWQGMPQPLNPLWLYTTLLFLIFALFALLRLPAHSSVDSSID